MSLRIRDVTIKYDQLRWYSSDCSTGVQQPDTSEIITDLEKVSLPIGPVLKLILMLLPLLKFLLSFCKTSSLSGDLRLLHIRLFSIRSHRFDKLIWHTKNRSTQIEPRERLLQKIGQTRFELMRRNENNDVFKKNLFRAATDLVESIVFRSQGIAFSEDKNGLLQTLVLYHEPKVNSNFRSFSMRPQNPKDNPTYPSASGCTDPKIAPDIHKKALSELQKLVVHIPLPDLGWKLS